MKEAFRVIDWRPDEGELCILYEAARLSRWVQVPYEDDLDGETFNDFWIEGSDDVRAAGYVFPDDEAPAVWRGEGPEPERWTVMRLRPAETMPDWMERAP